jgi:cysteine desulfurase family protein (TIGR01976 family)
MSTAEIATAAALDLHAARRHFPALASGFAFFDNAGGSQVLATVADAIRDYLLSSNVQLGASYEVSQRATERVAAGVGAAAALMNADPGEIVLGGSTTQLLANLGRAMGPSLGPGDEVVVTNADHESNVGPWARLAERGVTLRVWEVEPETQELSIERLAGLLGERTRLLCMPHVSNVIGSIHPVAAAVRLAHAAGARVLVDGVAYAPHRAVDVRALDVDFYVVSFYKIFGPHNAALYGKRERLLELANVNHFFFGPEAVPAKLQPGGPTYELAAGLPPVLAYLEELGGGSTPGSPQPLAAAFAAIAAHEERLVAPLLEFLAGRRGVRILGRREADRRARVATVSFTVAGKRPEEVTSHLDRFGIGARHGDFYARRLVTALGLVEQGGVVRISMVHYNTADEVAKVIRHLDEIL